MLLVVLSYTNIDEVGPVLHNQLLRERINVENTRNKWQWLYLNQTKRHFSTFYYISCSVDMITNQLIITDLTLRITCLVQSCLFDFSTKILNIFYLNNILSSLKHNTYQDFSHQQKIYSQYKQLRVSFLLKCLNLVYRICY